MSSRVFFLMVYLTYSEPCHPTSLPIICSSEPLNSYSVLKHPAWLLQLIELRLGPWPKLGQKASFLEIWTRSWEELVSLGLCHSSSGAGRGRSGTCLEVRRRMVRRKREEWEWIMILQSLGPSLVPGQVTALSLDPLQHSCGCHILSFSP